MRKLTLTNIFHSLRRLWKTTPCAVEQEFAPQNYFFPTKQPQRKICSGARLEKPWYLDSSTKEENARAMRAFQVFSIKNLTNFSSLCWRSHPGPVHQTTHNSKTGSKRWAKNILISGTFSDCLLHGNLEVITEWWFSVGFHRCSWSQRTSGCEQFCRQFLRRTHFLWPSPGRVKDVFTKEQKKLSNWIAQLMIKIVSSDSWKRAKKQGGLPENRCNKMK